MNNGFPTDYNQIQDRMLDYDPTDGYQETRNDLDGHVSRLSPYITHGVLPLRKVFTHYFHKYKLTDAYKFLQELTWREFFQRVWWNHGDDIFTDLRREQPDVERRGIPQALVQASTGINAVDSQLKQLRSTGYVHNHARMWIASMACNIGRFHWWQPSRWFYFHLLDGDPASNMINWQHVAGSASYSKYWFNQHNVNKYATQKQHGTWLDTSYENVKNGNIDIPSPVTEDADIILKTNLPETQVPEIDTAKPLLLYHNFHLDPQWRADMDANRVLILEPDHFDRFPVADQVIDFVIEVAKNINNIQVYVGNPEDLPVNAVPAVYTKAHQAYQHWPGTHDQRDIIFRSVADEDVGLVFTPYWKEHCYPRLKALSKDE
jgi:deoxyribodipyrimidine photo-lyase